MKFKFLLFILYLKLKTAAGKNAKFIQFIKDRHLHFVIKTADEKSGRQFHFSNGKITSRSGLEKATDFVMVWVDPNTAFKVMSNSNEEATVAALTEKKLVVEGDLKAFMWFSRAIDIMMGKA